jgi:hypothetical protein
MKSPACEHLEDYLLCTLSSEQQAAFLEHLGGCHECSEAVRDQERLHRIFRTAVSFEAVPVGLADRVEASLLHSSRRRILLRVSTATAAAVVFALAMGLWFNSKRAEHPQDLSGGRASPEIALHQEAPIQPRPVNPPTAQPPKVPVVRVTFSPAESVIAVPEKSGNPNVTILWIYPTENTRESARTNERSGS